MWLLFAAGSAFCFGLRGILYQWTSRKPIDRNLLLLGVYLAGTIVALGANGIVLQPWTGGAAIGILMGALSFSANSAMYKGFAVGKASLIAILTALPPVVVVGLAYLFWRETLSIWQGAAFALIVAGILLIRYSNDISLKALQGAGWGLLAMVTFGLTDLSSKQATLSGAETLPALAVMYATGTLLFLGAWLIGARRKRLHGSGTAAGERGTDGRVERETYGQRTADGSSNERCLNKITPEHPVPASEASGQTSAGDYNDETKAAHRECAAAAADEPHQADKAAAPPAAWPFSRTLLWGMAVGLTNISGMIFALPAFKQGITGLVSAVLAMNVLLILLYARFFLKESFKRLEICGLILAFIGMLLLRLAA